MNTLLVIIGIAIVLVHGGLIYVLISVGMQLAGLKSTLNEVHMEVNSRLTMTQEKLDETIKYLSTSEERLSVSMDRIAKLESMLKDNENDER